ALVLLAVAFEELPRALASWGAGSPCIARAVVTAPVLAAILFTLIIDHRYFATKQWTIAPGTPDSFRIDSRGLEVQLMQSGIEAAVAPNQTLAVFPQGLMLNYL